jgi:hypothetical protein
VIHHIVQFQWKPDVTAEQIQKAGAGLLAMRGRIDEIRDIRFGPNMVEEQVPYTHVLVVVLDDMAAVRRYAVHPVHVETVATCTRPILATRLAADLDVGSAPVPHAVP